MKEAVSNFLKTHRNDVWSFREKLEYLVQTEDNEVQRSLKVREKRL